MVMKIGNEIGLYVLIIFARLMTKRNIQEISSGFGQY